MRIIVILAPLTVNNLIVSQSATIESLDTISAQNAQGGIKFGTASGLPSGFVRGTLVNYGTLTTSGTFSGPISALNVPNITFFVVDNLVTMVVPRIATTGNTTSSILTGAAIVPVQLRPAVSVKNSVVCCSFRNLNVEKWNFSAYCEVDSGTGNLLIAPNFVSGIYSGVAFPGSLTANPPFIIENFSMSWKL